MADLFVGVERSESAQIQQTDFGGAVLLGRRAHPSPVAATLTGLRV